MAGESKIALQARVFVRQLTFTLQRENELRKFNFVPLIYNMLRVLAERNDLAHRIESAKEKRRQEAASQQKVKDNQGYRILYYYHHFCMTVYKYRLPSAPSHLPFCQHLPDVHHPRILHTNPNSIAAFQIKWNFCIIDADDVMQVHNKRFFVSGSPIQEYCSKSYATNSRA